MRKVVLLFFVAPLALVACGGSSHQTSNRAPKLSPVAYVRRAAQKTAQVSAERETMTGKVGASGVDISMSGSGDFSNIRHRGSFAATFSASGVSGTIDEVLDGTAIYMTSPLFTGSLPNGKKWMKLDLQQLGTSKGIDFSALLSRNPTQAFQQLEAAGTVTQLGTETIGGVAATHFRVENLDVAKLPQGAKIEALGHPTYGPIDVWIGNADGYVYRETLSFSYAVSGHEGSMSMRLDFSHFGESVHVNVPPASETADMTSQALKGLGG